MVQGKNHLADVLAVETKVSSHVKNYKMEGSKEQGISSSRSNTIHKHQCLSECLGNI